MASRFQSRLVGTIILVALGVIILPDVLDGKKSHYKDDVTAIPLKPESQIDESTFVVSEPEMDDHQLPDSPVRTVVGVASSTSSDSVASESSTSQQRWDVVETETVVSDSPNSYESSAWIIQLMALKNADNAYKLVEDLKKRGFVASTKKENGFTRVIIGPDVSKEKMEKQIVELKKITGAEGQLIKFKPLNP